MPGRDSVPCDTLEGINAMIVLDWKDGCIVGLEMLDASHTTRTLIYPRHQSGSAEWQILAPDESP